MAPSECSQVCLFVCLFFTPVVANRPRTTEGTSCGFLQVIVQEAGGRSHGPCFDIGTDMRSELVYREHEADTQRKLGALPPPY